MAMAEKLTHGQKLEKIYKAVVGEPELGTKGIIPRLDDCEKKITDLQEVNKKRWWFVAGASTGAGFVGGLVGGPTLKFIIAKISSSALAKISSALLFFKP